MKNFEVTKQTFNRFLSDTFRNLKTLRARVQALIEFGVHEFADSGNTIYLTKTLREATVTHGLNAKGIQAYIQEAAQVQWGKDKVGDMVFKKKKTEDGAELVNAEVLTTPWFDWVASNLGSNNAQAEWTREKYALTVCRVLKKHEVDVEEFKKFLTAAKKAA